MTRHADLLGALSSARIVAVLRIEDAEIAIRTAEALIEGGIRAIELTFTTPNVQRAVRHVVRAHPRLTLGVGTVTTQQQAESAVDAGASFLVSPGSPVSLVDAMLATGVTVIAGCLTPTEILTAHQVGAHAIKIFPANTVGPGYLASLRGPFPDLQLIPTGGIRPADVSTWLDAGALAVGIGGQLSQPVRTAGEHQTVVAAARAAMQPSAAGSPQQRSDPGV